MPCRTAFDVTSFGALHQLMRLRQLNMEGLSTAMRDSHATMALAEGGAAWADACARAVQAVTVALPSCRITT